MHPAIALNNSANNIHVIVYREQIYFGDLLLRINRQFGAERVTVQSGGALNAILVRLGLIDRILLVVAPALIGGKNTSTLMDGESLHAPGELNKSTTLELVQARALENSCLLHHKPGGNRPVEERRLRPG